MNLSWNPHGPANWFPTNGNLVDLVLNKSKILREVEYSDDGHSHVL
jgi:hypothetical protein